MKKKKIFCLFLGAAAVLLTGSLLALAEETGSAEELQEGQRIARIRVVSIVGNELTYYEIEEESEEATTEETEEETEKQTEETADLSESERIPESETEGAAEDNSEGETEGSGGDFPAGELPDDFSQEELPGGEFPQGESGEFPGGEFPQGKSGEFPGGEFPQGESGDFPAEVSGEGPETSSSEEVSEEAPEEESETPSSEEVSEEASEKEPEMSSSEEASETFSMEDVGENSGSFFQGRMEQQENAQTVTVYLPVAVKVHTDEEDRTFPILEAGDELEVLLQEDEDGEETITEIWMTGAEGEME